MANRVIEVASVGKEFVINRDRANSVRAAIGRIGKSTKSREEDSNIQLALKNVSFEVEKGDFFGIVGRNGSGKSTLLKIIAGIYQPTEGSVKVRGKLVPFIELGVGFNPELSARENVYLNGAMLGFTRAQVDGFYDTVVEFSELEKHMEKKLKNFSSGMQVRLAFSIAIQADAEILLIDEVLAVGDSSFRRKCYDYFDGLKTDNKTVIFVTHDMNSVRKYCNKALLIEKSQVVLSGTPDKVADKYDELFLQKKKRSGNNAVKLLRPEVNATESKITIKYQCKATKAIDDINIGFSIANLGGSSILGSNTQIVGCQIDSMGKGQVLHLEWELDNLLKDGGYLLSLAAVDRSGKVRYDWWQDALEFHINEQGPSPHLIAPEVRLNLT